MRQKKYLGRRIAALLLALMLSLNTAVAYAAADIPGTNAVSETSEISADRKEPESEKTTENVENKTETKEETGKKDADTEETGKKDADTEETGKKNADTEETGKKNADTEETGKKDADTEETGKKDADTEETGKKDADTEETGEKDSEIETEEEKLSEDTDAETESEELLEVEETPEMPEEVKAFLDAAAALPSADEVTTENAEEVRRQADAAFELYDILIELDLGYHEREDVAEAVKKAKAVLEAVLSVNEPDELAVQAFLDAVDSITVPEEDLALEENADLAGSYSAAVYEAFELYEALSEEQQELEEVMVSYMELENMAMVLPDFSSSAYALTNVTVSPDYDPGQCYPGVTKHGGAVTKSVGESGFYKRRAVHNFYCRRCGWFYGQSTAKEYANIQWEQSVTGVIDNVSFNVGTLDGYQCLEMDFTGAEAGTTLVTLQYDVNFHTRWNSGYANCPGCGAGTSVQQYDDNWYHYEDTFYVTVESPRHEDRAWYVYVPTNGIENGSATIELNAVAPKNSIYYYNSYYGYVYNKYNMFMPMEDASLSDPNGVQGSYADISWKYTRHKNWVGAPSYDYGIELTVTGLDTPTPDGEPISVFLNSKWPYKATLVDQNDFFVYYNLNGWNTVTEEIKIVVYDPETVTVPVGETYRHNYGAEMTGKSVEALTWGAYVRTLDEAKASPNKPMFSKSDVVDLSYTQKAELTSGGTYDYYNVTGKESGIGDTTKVSTTYTYFGNYVGGGSNYVFVYPRTTYVDVVNYKVVKSDDTTTPVTIVKEFDGITAGQIPDDFTLTYKVNGCTEHNTITGTLKKSDAALSSADGTPRLIWNVDLPVAKHGSAVHTITFSENSAGVTGYKTPVMSGASIKLEELAPEEGAAKPVITVTNKYELEDNVFELFYDFNGGTDGPASQVYKGESNEVSHAFLAAGSENPIKIPVNGDKVFKGWSETLNGSVVYVYDSVKKDYYKVNGTRKEYSPKVTVTRKSGEDSASKTLYAVWEAYTAPEHQLDSLVKERIKSTELPAGVDLSDGVKVNDDDTVVFLGDDPEPVTLLYKITVKGTAGAEYKVTDDGAEWVSGGDAHQKDGSKLIITGTIEADKTSAEIYVTKTFEKSDIEGGRLTNEAELESNDPDTEGPEDGTGSGSADAEKKYTVIINFITDDEEPETLQDPIRNEVDEGEKFGVSYSGTQSRMRRNTAGEGTLAIYIPKTITRGGKIYVLDEVLSKNALDDLKKAGEAGVTADIMQNIIYSLDMKGQSAAEEEDGSDGIPDKYQAKIVYLASEGGSQDGEDKYVTITDADGIYSREGETSVSAEAEAEEDYYFHNWTASAKGHESWNYSAHEEEKLSGDISIKGGAVYTFTANFAKKGTLSLTADEVNTVYDGEEHPVTPSVSAGDAETEGVKITITYVDAEGNELSGAPVDAGTYTAKIKAELSGYKDAECEAVVTIARRRLTVTTGSADKTYDGTPLTNSTASVVVEGGIVPGEVITVAANGSRTEVGSAVNTYTLNWGSAKESNYEVVERLGTLTVNAAGGTGGSTGGGGGGSNPDPDPVPSVEWIPIIPEIIPMAEPEAAVTPAPTAQGVSVEAEPVPAAESADQAAETVELSDEEVPLAAEDQETDQQPKPETMEDEEVPLAGGNGGAWALVNFALMNLAVFESLMLLIGYFVNTKNEREDEDEKRKLKKKGIFRVISIPIAVISLIVFILTEDITLPTAFVDKYTVVMLIIAAVQTVVAALSNKKYEDEEEA